MNLLTTPRSDLLATLPQGDWALAAVDLTAVALGLGFAWLARRQHRGLMVAPRVPAPQGREASA